jgi:hypothetical protein
VNQDRDHALIELTRRNPFWVCLLVFALLAADTGFRLANSVRQRGQLDQAQLVQAQNVGRMSSTLSQLPQIEAKLQALSVELVQLAKTNANAAQLVREFNIQWNPAPEAFLAPPALPPVAPAPEPAATATAAPATNTLATNAPAAK